MKTKLIVVSLCVLALLGAFCVGWKFYGKPRTQPTQNSSLLFHPCPHLNRQTQARLKKHIAQELQTQKSAKQILKTVQSDVPAITNITINRRVPGTISVKIDIDQPYVYTKHIPHQHLILCKKGSYTSRDIFQNESIMHIPCILVTSTTFDEADRSLLASWLASIPERILFEYTIEWKKPTEIALQDNTHPQCQVILEAHKPLTPDLEEKIRRIREHALKKNRKKRWRIDARFDDQIVLTPYKKMKIKEGQ